MTGWRRAIMEQSIVFLPHLMLGADVGDGALDAHFVAATLERIFAQAVAQGQHCHQPHVVGDVGYRGNPGMQTEAV